MPGIANRLKARARNAARAAALSVMGAVFGLVGLAFLTVALWILIAEYESPLVAFTAIGALYLVLGFSILALGGQKSGSGSDHGESGHHAASSVHGAPEPREPFVQLAEGFALGMQAGRAARERRH